MAEAASSGGDTRLARAEFIRQLLNDVRALDIMLEKGIIESDRIRIGAEQEFLPIHTSIGWPRKGKK